MGIKLKLCGKFFFNRIIARLFLAMDYIDLFNQVQILFTDHPLVLSLH
jgi:hypothetical protein